MPEPPEEAVPRRAEAAPTSEESPQSVADGRREFIKIAVVASAAIATGGLGALAKSVSNPGSATVGEFPRVKVANISALQANKPVSFFYPLDNEPNLLVRLGQEATHGVGPGHDIVAYSQLCQHLGCVYGYQATGTSPKCDRNYSAPSPIGYCCCHGTAFDFVDDGKVVSGPSPRPLPRVILEVAGDEIFAVGMTPPTIFGHQTGSDDVSNDLKGGNLVS